MKVLLSWLREFCPVEVSAEELAGVLTSRGAKVETIDRPWDRLSGVVVARVLEVGDHPNSDKLCLARVDTGSGERAVVVGVRNMVPGDLVPLAQPGTSVPGLPEPLSARDIRGVRSEGMLCSARELGISPDHQAILVLPPHTAVGVDFKAAFGLDEAVLDIEVTPNRPDLMSVIGVAREAAAATGVPLVPPNTTVVEAAERTGDAATVEILDLERCPRYLARVIRGVQVGPSPVTARARLYAAGTRPLSNVVDATNYALLEMGHPMHPFDLALLEGPGIVVRRAEEGERFTTLDGVERTMTAEDLMIADRGRSVAVAGVMGGVHTEVSDSTRDVLLESAYFQPSGIARTSRRLELSTEASKRFERGADPESVSPAADRAAALIVAWSGGSVLAGPVEQGSAPSRRRLSVRPQRASALIGHQVTREDVLDAFSRLGIDAGATDGSVEVEVPGYRVDLQKEIDLIEEVARVQGYDRVGSTLPGIRQPGGVPDTYSFRRRIREALVRAGLRETWSMSFASHHDLDLLGGGESVRVANPLAADQAFLRTSLLPGLLRALRTNVAHQVRGAALFEVGRVFRPGDPVAESELVAVGLTGPGSPGYPGDRRDLDFLDAKGVVESLFASLGVDDWGVGEPLGPPFHAGRSAAVLVGGKPAGVIGELHPGVAEREGFDRRVGLAELDTASLVEGAGVAAEYREVARRPPVRRDLAFVVGERTPAGAVHGALLDAGGELVEAVILFDVFTGGPIPAGKKSLAFSVDFRVPERTLTDAEVEETVRRIVERLASEFGADIRAG